LDFDIFLRSGSRIQPLIEAQRVLLQVGAHDRGEQPGADDVVALRTQVHRVHLREQLRVPLPAARELRGEGGGGPGVEDVGVGDEAAGLVPLRLGEARGHVDRRVDRERLDRRGEHGVVVGLAVLAHRVPDREGHAVEALAGDQPVTGQALDPVAVAGLHVGGMPGQLRAAGDELVAQPALGGVAAAVGEVPLAGGDELERLVAVLVELHRVGDLLRLADEVAGLGDHLDHALLRAEHGQSRELRVGGLALGGGDPRRLGQEAAVAADDGAGGQLELAPPDDVVGVAEGADHRDACALVGLGEPVGEHRHLDPEQGRGDGGAEQALVALVLGVGDQRHAGREQLGTGGLDIDGGLCVLGRIRAGEADAVVGALAVPVLLLGLRDRGAVGDVPHGGGLGLVGLPRLEVLEEGPLRGRAGVGVDGLVAVVPVHGETQGAEDLLEGLLVQGGQLLAQLDEVAARDRDLVRGLRGLVRAALLRGREVRVVGQRGIAAHAVVVLGAALGGQAVVVPAQRVEAVLAAHALVAHDHVRLRVAEHVADVQRARGRRRRGVDAEHLVTGGVLVEGVELLLAPYAVPLLLETLERGTVGDRGLGVRARCGIGHAGHCSRSAVRCNAGVSSVSALA
jgi:hypothetical protein